MGETRVGPVVNCDEAFAESMSDVLTVRLYGTLLFRRRVREPRMVCVLVFLLPWRPP